MFSFSPPIEFAVMGRKTKPFISKKTDKVHNFRLVHRSQRDPLIADEDAPERVLVPFTPSNQPRGAEEDAGAFAEKESAISSARARERALYDRKAKNAELGIFFDDDYDYSQHVRERGQEGAEATLADLAEVSKIVKEKVKQGLVLPEAALPSQYENPVGMLNLAAPVSGPRLDLDPDIAATLDDEFAHDDDFVLDDDFIAQAGSECDEDEIEDPAFAHRLDAPGTDRIQDWRARVGLDTGVATTAAGAAAASGENAPQLVPSAGKSKKKPADDDDEEEDEDGDDVSSTGHAGHDDDDEDDEDEYEDGEYEIEETKSRFTEYSMSSSVVPRSKGLQLHDSRFEQFYAQYDDELIGPLEAEEEEEGKDIEAYADLLDEHLAKHGDTSKRNQFTANGRRISRTTQIRKRLAALKAAEAESQAAQGGGEAAPAAAAAAAPVPAVSVAASDAAVGEAVATENAEKKKYDDFGNLLPGAEESEPELSQEETEVLSYKPAPRKNWDCQSLTSTHSTLYNHPSTIGYIGPKKKITFTSKGLPVVLPEEPAVVPSEAPAAPAPHESEDSEHSGEEEGPRENKGVGRARSETAEERRQRKKLIKEERRERRQTKKATTVLFKQEEQRQESARRGNAFNPAAGRMG